MPPGPHDTDNHAAHDGAASDHTGAWAAAAVLVIAVVLASGAVG